MLTEQGVPSELMTKSLHLFIREVLHLISLYGFMSSG